MSNITSMFESIKASLSNKSDDNSYRNILRTEVDKTYLVRFIPNMTVNPCQTFYHYYHHTWESKSTGQYVGSLCPTTWGDRCPLCEARFKLYKAKNDIASLLNRKENWLVNVYVISDPSNAENNNTVKIFRFGQQVKKIIHNAVEGDDAADIGPQAVFDLTEKGCNFRIKVEANEGGYPTYVFSKFLGKGPIEGMTPQKITDIMEKQVFDLTKVFKNSTKEELKKLLDVHVFAKEDSQLEFPPAEAVNTPVVESKPLENTTVINNDDELPGLESKPSVKGKPLDIDELVNSLK